MGRVLYITGIYRQVVGLPAATARKPLLGILGLLHHKHFMRVDEKRAVLFVIYSKVV